MIGVGEQGGRMYDMATTRKPGRPKNPDSKRSQGVDRHTMPRVVYHAPDEMLKAFGKYVSSLKPAVSDAAAHRFILGTFLKERGLLPKDYEL